MCMCMSSCVSDVQEPTGAKEALGPPELDLGAKGSGELRPVLHQSRMRSEHSNLQNHHHIP